MRTIALSLALSLTTIFYVSAQTVTNTTRMSKGMFSAVPKEITSDGNGYLLMLENEADNPAIKIFSNPDENGLIKTINLPVQDSGDNYYEVANGVKENVVITGKFYDRFPDYGIIDSIAQMDSIIIAIWGYKDFQLIPFTDADSMPAYYGNNLTNNQFYEYEKYGTKYPLEYYALDSLGYLCLYHFFGYAVETDMSDVTWTKDLEYSKNQGYQEKDYYLASFKYQDIDKSFYPTNELFASQNIFDDNTDWEYILFDMEFLKKAGSAQKYSDEKYRREIDVRPYHKGMKIMNDKNAELTYIKIPDKEDEHTMYINILFISLINGTLYIQTEEDVMKGSFDNNNYDWIIYNGLYAIDPLTTKVMSIKRTQLRLGVNPNVIEQGDRLNIQVSEPGRSDLITISTMSGQAIKTTSIDNGNTSVETSSIPKGIYNVTLHSTNSPAENQRIIIK